MPHADLLGRCAWVWPQSYWREGESAWLTAHKFGFLNGLDKAALGRALAGLDPTGEQVAKSAPRHLFRRIASERALGMRPCARHDTLRAFTLEELFAEHLDKVADPVVRFCPACIAQWFHASIFQLAGVRSCPFHHLCLQSGCPRCGHPIHAAFDPASFAHPLHCWRCGAPFAGRQPRFCELFERTETEAARIAASIQGELMGLCHATCVQGVASEYPYPAAAHLEVLLAGTRARGQLDGAADGQQWLQFQMHDFRRLKVEPSRAQEAFTLSKQTLRAIGRHLARWVRGRCGHRHPPSLTLHRVGRDMMEPCWLSATHPLSVVRSSRQGLCACCFALARWRVSFAAIFHAHQHHQRVEAVDLSAQLDYLIEPQVALDLFGMCVVQTAHAIGLDLSAPGSQDWSGKTDQEEAQHLCVWPPPYWCVLRRNDGRSWRCAGYGVACIDDLLQRLANISLMGESPWGIGVGCTRRAVWGQDMAEYRMKLPRPGRTPWFTKELIDQILQDTHLRVRQAMAQRAPPVPQRERVMWRRG